VGQVQAASLGGWKLKLQSLLVGSNGDIINLHGFTAIFMAVSNGDNDDHWQMV